MKFRIFLLRHGLQPRRLGDGGILLVNGRVLGASQYGDIEHAEGVLVLPGREAAVRLLAWIGNSCVTAKSSSRLEEWVEYP